ncbi:hypothetical protein ACFSM7_16475 [Clavibacter michiganensis subsp. tessellarius]
MGLLAGAGRAAPRMPSVGEVAWATPERRMHAPRTSRPRARPPAPRA